MNRLILSSPNFYLGDQGHPFCETGIQGITAKTTCLVDTGFSLGFAFSQKSISRFKFSEGYVITMLLGNGAPTKGIVFPVEVLIQNEAVQEVLGMTSVVFMEKKGDPLLGIETIRLFSPVHLDWNTNQIIVRS